MELGPNGPREVPLPTGLPSTTAARMLRVKLDGDVGRLCFGRDRDLPDDVLLDRLLRITQDPYQWGLVLGHALARVDRNYPAHGRVVALARAAGADEAAAAIYRVWLLDQWWFV
jgi:hypothetical protein